MFPFLKKLDRAQKALLYTCFYAFFVNGLVTLMLGSLMPDLKAAWGLTDTQGGVLLSAYSTGTLVAGFVSGVIPMYLGRRRSIAMLSSLCVVGMLMVRCRNDQASQKDLLRSLLTGTLGSSVLILLALVGLHSVQRSCSHRL